MKAGGILQRIPNVDEALLRLARIDVSSPLKQVLVGLGFAVLALGVRILLKSFSATSPASPSCFRR